MRVENSSSSEQCRSAASGVVGLGEDCCAVAGFVSKSRVGLVAFELCETADCV